MKHTHTQSLSKSVFQQLHTSVNIYTGQTFLEPNTERFLLAERDINHMLQD